LTRWILPFVFKDLGESNMPVTEVELRKLINKVFGRLVKNLKIRPGSIRVEGDNYFIFAEGTVAKVFSYKDQNEERPCQIEIAFQHSPRYPLGIFTINLIDPETGEIRQKQYDYTE
jgi:hypothetical protein